MKTAPQPPVAAGVRTLISFALFDQSLSLPHSFPAPRQFLALRACSLAQSRLVSPRQMASLAEKIEADASTKLAEKRQPGDDLTRYKGFLKLENSRLQMLHRAGGSGREVCHGRAIVLDVLLRH